VAHAFRLFETNPHRVSSSTAPRNKQDALDESIRRLVGR
jgi:hypothetical protein